MSDASTTAGDSPAPTTPPKAAKTTAAVAKADRGVHVVFGGLDKDAKAVAIYSGEIESLRHAMRIGGTARKVAFGEEL